MVHRQVRTSGTALRMDSDAGSAVSTKPWREPKRPYPEQQHRKTRTLQVTDREHTGAEDPTEVTEHPEVGELLVESGTAAAAEEVTRGCGGGLEDEEGADAGG